MKTETNKSVIKILIAIIVILVIFLIVIIINKNKEQEILKQNVAASTNVDTNYQQSPEDKIEVPETPTEVKVLSTMQDSITTNSIWSCSFQLAWNDMLEEIVKDGEIKDSKISTINYLNSKDFTSNDLNSSYYYKSYGLKSQKIKGEIESELKKKFTETSEILNELDWTAASVNNPKDNEFSKYLVYSMLKRSLEFEKSFTVLEKGTFGDASDIKYFGINSQTSNEVRQQVDVLYYDSVESYAVSLNSKDGNKIILVKDVNNNELNFNNIYKNVIIKSENFTGDQLFEETDSLKVPNLDIDISKDYKEIRGLEFPTKTEITGIVEDAIQVVKIKLGGTGGIVRTNSNEEAQQIKRKFNFDNQFMMFLVEKEKDNPYFAAYISNINLFQ